MKEQLRALISESCGLPGSAITDDAVLTRDLGLDSLDTVDLILKLEDTFGVAIPDEDYPQLQTISKIYSYLEPRVAAMA